MSEEKNHEDNVEKKTHKKVKKHNKSKKSMWITVLAVVAIIILINQVYFNNKPDTAATVNGEIITNAQLDAQWDAIPIEFRQLFTKAELLDRMIGFTLLKQEAEKSGYSTSESDISSIMDGLRGPTTEEDFLSQIELQYGSIDKFKDELSETVLIQKYVTENIKSMRIVDGEIEQMYNEYSDLSGQDLIRANHILLETRDEAEKIIERLNTGENFTELAKENSIGPSSVNGGDLGWFTRGQMVPEFEEAAFALETGKVSDVVETQFGFHVIKVFDKKEGATKSYEEMEPFLKFTLFNQKQQINNQALLDFIESKKVEAKIKISFDEVPEEEVIEISSQKELEEILNQKIDEIETVEDTTTTTVAETTTTVVDTTTTTITVDNSGCFTSEENVILYYREGNEESMNMKAFAGDEILLVERTSDLSELENCVDGFNKFAVPQLICKTSGEVVKGEVSEEDFNSFVESC